MHRSHAAYGKPPTSQNELLQRFGALIERVARSLVRRTGMHGAIDDLRSAGAMGLLEAARRFDQGRDVRFETFAEHRIRGAMLDELRRQDHLPRRLRDRVDSVVQERRKLTARLGRDATDDELAQALGLEVEEVAEISVLHEPHVPIAELPLQSEAPSPDVETSRRQTQARLTEAIAELPERLQLVVSLYYVEELTYREIAQILKVSEPRVCQLHSEAMSKLRNVLAPPEDETDEDA